MTEPAGLELAGLELVRPVKVDRIPDDGQEATVDANAAECAAVAARLLLPAVARLQCRWTLHKEPKGALRADGVLRAEVTQECGVSLEQFTAAVAEVFTVRFVIAGRESGTGDDPEEPDELPYDGVVVDLGEATVEQLALALDPYPRKPGAVLADEADTQPQTAFAALAKLRRLD